MTVRITQDRPLRLLGDIIVFQAEDDGGPFELWASALLWERLQAEAPLPCTAEDCRDYALGMIEATAAGGEPVVALSGLRLLVL